MGFGPRGSFKAVAAPAPPVVGWVDLGSPISGELGVYALAHCGSGIILAGTYNHAHIARSANYGTSWADISLPVSGEQSVPDVVYCGGGIAIAGTGGTGHILRSADYGLTWSDITTPAAEIAITSLCYLGGGIVIAGTGNLGKIFRSTDYGLTWSDQGRLYINGNLVGHIVDLGGGVVIADTYSYTYNFSAVYRSTDWGLTWSFRSVPLSPYTITGMCYDSGVSRLYAAIAVGSHGVLLYSTDQGLTWSSIDSYPFPDSKWAASLLYIGSSTLYAGLFGGKIAISADDGNTWIEDYSTGEDYVYTLLDIGSGIEMAGTAWHAKVFRKGSVPP